MDGSSICAQCVTSSLQQNATCQITAKDTQDSRIPVTSVGSVFCLIVACIPIGMFTQVSTSAQNVANVVKAAVLWQDTSEVIQDRNHLDVLFVTNDLQCQVRLLGTAEFTAETNRTNVTCVTRRLVTLEL